MCESSNSETIFADVNRNWKLTSSINFIYGTYLWKFQLSLDPKTWHGSYFYLEILVCKFWQDLKMEHLHILMRDHFNVKMFLLKFFPLGKSFITIPSDSWLTKKSCVEGDQPHGGLAKHVRVDTRFHFST